MKLISITTALLIASSLSAPAFAVSKATEDFLTKATIGNRFEITASDMALVVNRLTLVVRPLNGYQ